MRPAARPQRLLLSEPARQSLDSRLQPLLAAGALQIVAPVPGADFDLGFVSRDVTGLSTKHEVLPATQQFHDLLLGAPSLRWVQVHSAGVDRPVFVELQRRGVQVSPASGANASVVAQTALAGLLALARRLPLLMEQQRAHRWAPLIASGMPRDLAGQTVVLVGWGPVARQLAPILQLLGLRLVVLRTSSEPAAPGVPTHAYEAMPQVLPGADWLLLACPLSERTRGLVDARRLALLPTHAHVLNLARGELIDEDALVQALRTQRLAGAFLDVFTHEPLGADSPLWDLPQVIVTPHSAGFSDGNAARVDAIFLAALQRQLAGHGAG